ncbi:fibrous sheath-interacting protein 1-like [Plakobranchus ocellatus]|uniref:Fibrous sheath-interacting protein 1 n=1 Tax=Plakobranchus ocellatus TaxID=259542 RepID=A0AAV4CHE5_9GAST|nr:fibrous sheath-interacting protein 1-like [Plakobranchus ocellatus]
MAEENLATQSEAQGSLDSFKDDEDFDEDDDLIDDLEDLDIKDLNPRTFQALDAVYFDDDADEQELLAICSSLKEGASHALVTQEESEKDDDEADIGSDEERDILKEIREDIEQKVREEMKDELNGYHERIKAIQDGFLPGRTDDEKNNDSKAEDNEELNPQLREAIIKMNKLDKILRKKVKREKEVKRERILLERRMRQEISEMEHGASNFREIKMNTEKFLALAPPPSHNEGVSLEPEDDEEMTPLFQTQFDDSDLDRRKSNEKNSGNGRTADSQDVGQPRSGSSVSSQGARSKSSRSGLNLGSKSQDKKKKKDFIKRNKELAAEADQPVAMTDDEKRRLQTLLEGVDDLPEIEEGEENVSLMDFNPFQISVQPGEGFCPDSTESRTLSAIDQRLRGLMPEEDFKAAFSFTGLGAHRDRDSHRVTPSQQPLFTRVGLHSTGNDAAALERFGERVLYDTKEERELKARLLAIESQLEEFKAPQEMEDETVTDYHLTDQQLEDLLDQCARNMGHTVDTPGSTPRSQLSSRQSLLANPPRLTDEQLQQLLSDAQFPLSSRLLALRDDDQKLEEEDGSTEMIRAETWLAIRDAKIDEDMGTGETETSQEDTILLGPEANSDSKLGIFRSDETYGNVGGRLSNDRDLSLNNASRSDAAHTASRTSLSERGEIDDFAYTPDIINSKGLNDSDKQHSNSDSLSSVTCGAVNGKQEEKRRVKNVRENSGGARSKTRGSFGLPRLPHPPQLSSSSSSLKASAESDAASRLSSSSFVYSSNNSYDSTLSTPVNKNNSSTLGEDKNLIRFPEIPSKSFLIHAPQGMNNDERVQPKDALPSRPPLQMVRNNLSDMSVTSLSTNDREDGTASASGSHLASSVEQDSSVSSSNHRVPLQRQVSQHTPTASKKQE